MSYYDFVSLHHLLGTLLLNILLSLLIVLIAPELTLGL